MTDSNKQPLDAFVVENYSTKEGDKSYWHRVGAAFPNNSGGGFSLVIPKGINISGTVQLLPKKERKDNK